MVYYVIIDGEQIGPLSLPELLDYEIAASTPVWREDMPQWGVAADFEELADTLRSGNEDSGSVQQPSVTDKVYYFAVINNAQAGPITAEELVQAGVCSDTLVWKEGMADWAKASSVPELAEMFARRVPPPFPKSEPQRFAASGFAGGYRPNETGERRYNGPTSDPYQQAKKSNWMGWAIFATVLNFFFAWVLVYPLVGIGLGIAGIVLANTANNSYLTGNCQQAERSNNNAKICTIISLVIGGSGLLLLILAIGFFASLIGSASYFNWL